MKEWLARLSRGRGLVLYEKVDPEARVVPDQWLARPSMVCVGPDWLVLGDLKWKDEEKWWVMGNNGVSVAGPGLIVGLDTESRLTYLRSDQLERIQIWQRSGGPRVVSVR